MNVNTEKLISTQVYEQLTVSNAVDGVGFTKATIDTLYEKYSQQLAGVTFSVDGGDVRYKFKDAPTAALGVLLKDGVTYTFTSEEEVRNVLFIRTGASDVTLDAIFLRV
jgi:hypothetical protein